MLTNRLLKYGFMVMVLTYLYPASSQDLENLPDSLYLKVNGGISANAQAYISSGMDARRDPYSYLLSANLVFNLSDVITAPFSASISSGSKTFNQPSYTIMGISPKYKAFTLHAGHRDMQFSPYTLNGISFLGGGLEVAPKDAIYKFKVLAGRFAKGIPFRDDISGHMELPSYERWGWGGMITLGNVDYSGDLIVFKAKDKENSVDIPDSLSIAPKENLTFGINTRLKLIENIRVTTEFAGSAYTEDTRMDEVVYDRYTYLNNLGNLYTPRLSSTFSSAYAVSAGWEAESFSLGISYRRVAPNYKTLGATYMSNDFQNITLDASTTVYKDKITLSGNYGFQNNNLTGDKEQTTRRLITAVQGSFNINEKLNLSGNFSNYSTESKPVYINLVDSMRYIQGSKNYGGMVSYSATSEGMSHNIMLNVSVQNSDMLNNTATEVDKSNTLTKNALVSYTMTYQPLKVSVNSSVNIASFELEDNQSTSIGPVICIQRPFLKRKINSTISYSRMISISNGVNNATSIARLNISYKFLPKHTLKFSASATFLKRHENVEETEELVLKKSNETRFMLNYGFNF